MHNPNVTNKSNNRLTLQDLIHLSANDIATTTPIDQLEALQSDLADLQRDTKAKASKFNEALSIRYAAKASDARKLNGKDTGAVTLSDGDFRCAADLPKKVTWNQALLAHALRELEERGCNPYDFVEIEIKVSETKFNAWPPSIREVFAPARTVGTGAQTFKLSPKGAK